MRDGQKTLREAVVAAAYTAYPKRQWTAGGEIRKRWVESRIFCGEWGGSLRQFNSIVRSSLLTRLFGWGRLALQLQKIKNMKKIVFGAALIFAIGVAQAAPVSSFSHNEERNISSSGLPATLQSGIKNSYAGYWITELKAEGQGRHVKYTLTLENADEVVHLRAGKGNSWEVVSTAVKAD